MRCVSPTMVHIVMILACFIVVLIRSDDHSSSAVIKERWNRRQQHLAEQADQADNSRYAAAQDSAQPSSRHAGVNDALDHSSHYFDFDVNATLDHERARNRFQQCEQLPKHEHDHIVSVAAEVWRKPMNEMFWLHIPKCGTSFLNTLTHFACPGMPPEIHVGCSAHVDLFEIYSAKEIKRLTISGLTANELDMYECDVLFVEPPVRHVNLLVKYIPNTMVLFRTPEKRLISAFEWRMLRTLILPKTRRAELFRSVNKSKGMKEPAWKQLEIYHDFPGITGCQTKMVLGYGCCDTVNLTEADLAVAIERIKQFAFVGLTDEYDRSVDLFHAKFGGYQYDVEMLNSRPSKTRVKGSEHDVLYSSAQISDYYDEKLFEAVYRLVQDEFAKYNIPNRTSIDTAPPASVNASAPITRL